MGKQQLKKGGSDLFASMQRQMGGRQAQQFLQHQPCCASRVQPARRQPARRLSAARLLQKPASHRTWPGTAGARSSTHSAVAVSGPAVELQSGHLLE
jgi:hypothetical protein